MTNKYRVTFSIYEEMSKVESPKLIGDVRLKIHAQTEHEAVSEGTKRMMHVFPNKPSALIHFDGCLEESA